MEATVDESQRSEILQLTGDVAVLVIECLDKVSGTRSRSRSRVLIMLKVASSDAFQFSSDFQTHSRVLSTTSELSRGIQYLPLSCWVDPKMITLPIEPCTYGTRTGVYRGTHHGEPAAVKILRVTNQEDLAKLKEVSTWGVREQRNTWTRADMVRNQCFYKEASMWKCLWSPHILELGGVFFHNGVPAVVTLWMPHGNIAEYLEKHPDTDRLRLVSLRAFPAPGVIHFTSYHCLAFRCGQRSRVPPPARRSAWGHQSGEPPRSCGRSNREIVIFPDKHPHF